MHQIPAYQTAITLFSREGQVWLYPTLQAALKALGANWISRNVGAHFREYRGTRPFFYEQRGALVYNPVYEEHAFIMRDDTGAPVTWATFAQLRATRRFRTYRQQMLATWDGDGPVPGIHKVAAGAHYYRRPHTMNELREAALVIKEDGEVPPRPTRNKRYLPRSWDDLYVAARDNRNWKEYRKTQWK